MFTLIVTVLAVLAVLGFLFRIADSTTTKSGTIPSNRVPASRALRPANTPHLSVDPRDVR